MLKAVFLFDWEVNIGSTNNARIQFCCNENLDSSGTGCQNLKLNLNMVVLIDSAALKAAIIVGMDRNF